MSHHLQHWANVISRQFLLLSRHFTKKWWEVWLSHTAGFSADVPAVPWFGQNKSFFSFLLLQPPGGLVISQVRTAVIFANAAVLGVARLHAQLHWESPYPIMRLHHIYQSCRSISTHLYCESQSFNLINRVCEIQPVSHFPNRVSMSPKQTANLASSVTFSFPERTKRLVVFNILVEGINQIHSPNGHFSHT